MGQARLLGRHTCFRRVAAATLVIFIIRTPISDLVLEEDCGGAVSTLVIPFGVAMDTATTADMDFMVEALAATTARI